jgi:hypothetical protein
MRSRLKSDKLQIKLSLCLIKHYAMKMYGGSGCIGPRFLDLGTSLRRVVSITPCRCICVEKPRYPLYRRLSGPHSWSGRFGEVKILYPYGTRIPTPRSSSPQPVTISTTLPRPLTTFRLGSNVICLSVRCCYIMLLKHTLRYIYKQSPWFLVHKRTTSAELPLIGEFLMLTFANKGVSLGQSGGSPRPLISVFSTGATTICFE